MKGHAQQKWTDRSLSFEETKQEIQGRLPKGAFEFSENLRFQDIRPEEGDLPVTIRLKLAVKRDARWATAGGPYVRKFGLSQALRGIYNGSKQLVDGGAK